MNWLFRVWAFILIIWTIYGKVELITSNKVSNSQKTHQILPFQKKTSCLCSMSIFENLSHWNRIAMFRSTASFDRMLERATSNLLLEPDWNAILQICDSIRSGDTNAKYAVTSLKKKFYHENPHVVLYALTVSS